MTNGEKLKEIFPYLENDDTDLVKVLNIDNLKSWWNAEYKEPTPKNDLGVEDCISRKAVDDALYDYWHDIQCVDDSGCGVYQDSMEVINNLPSVTPQEPQSFKWCTDCKEYDQEKHCCHRWSKVIRDTVAEIRQEPKTGHWIDRDVYDADRWKCSECGRTEQYQENFCPNCGADMREVKK